MKGSYTALEELLLSKKKYELILEQMSDAVMILDTDGIIRYASPSRKRVFGETLDPIGRSFLEFVCEQDVFVVKSEFHKMMESASSDVFTVEFQRRQETAGTHIISEGRGRALYSAAGDVIGAICVLSDITLKKITEQQLRYFANHDSLTGVSNRRHFLEQLRDLLQESLQKQQSFLLVFADLNDFKQVNDSMGHLAGDELLKKVVLRLHQSAPSDAIIGRYGGDEFTLLVPGFQFDAGSPWTEIIKDIQQCFTQPFRIDAREVTIEASIGYSVFPDNGRDVDSLLRVADSMMYLGKHMNSCRPVQQSNQ